MSLTNKERIGRALDLLQSGIGPYADREFRVAFQAGAITPAAFRKFADDPNLENKQLTEWDVAALLKLMWETWNEVFKKTLGHAERSLVSELREVRNRWAHQGTFTADDAYRALDSVQRLLSAVSAPQVGDVEKMKMDLLRARFDEQTRGGKRRSAGTLVGSEAAGGLPPWREVVAPHPDVASGRYQQAEFAADLWQVHLGEGTDEYRDPIEFFRRTYLTESLKSLLVNAVRRLRGQGGDPVVQLQTNFGGGKTHSMLALYHLFSGVSVSELVGVEALLAEAGVNEKPPAARRVVLVGNKISPGSPSVKPDGTVVRTLWGEIAWQLGGKEAFSRVEQDDSRATSPGDTLRELFNEYAPCLILVDEWVAYARQLHEDADMPGGTFDTQFSFAQALTESAKLAKQTLLLVSLPASDTATSPHANTSEDVEVGGERGRRALERLRNVVGRLESSWRPASAEEGFEIVRRRLFEPMADSEVFEGRDNVCRRFADYYRSQSTEFPPECGKTEYELRMRAAYPIHPEVFDRLYGDWSTLPKFQRTRGVLRLMAAVIHALWEKGDKNPIILPASIPIDDRQVQDELTRYLADNWVPIIEKDVDGANSMPQKIDAQNTNLGKYHACRRVARTVFLGSAPITRHTNRGLEDRRVKLGCVLPGEAPSHYGDAMRRLSQQATYLYYDGARYWYETQPTVTKLAEDRAEQYRRDEDKYLKEIEERLRADLRTTGEFPKVHLLPQTSGDVVDAMETRLVVLSIDHPYSRDPDSLAEKFARQILDQRGNSPRLYRNTLVFLAPDRSALNDFVPEVCKYLAWKTIADEWEALSLSPHQKKQAETQRNNSERTLLSRLPSVYQWLLYPKQERPQDGIYWEFHKLTGNDPLAVRAAKKLQMKDDLHTRLGAAILRHELDRVPLWRGNHVAIRQLVDDFARYLYLSRLRDPSVLVNAMHDGFRALTWLEDSFVYADLYDEAKERYAGLRPGEGVTVSDHDAGLLVRSDVAAAQLEAERPTVPAPSHDDAPQSVAPVSGAGVQAKMTPPVPTRTRPRRFQGEIVLDVQRVGRDAAQIAQEVISHLSALDGAKLRVRLQVDCEIPDGAPDNVVRTVTENVRTLKFESGSGFELD
jgi:predicted AAA+ superfamily ATPase